MSSSSEAEVKWGWLPHSPLPPHPLIIWASPHDSPLTSCYLSVTLSCLAVQRTLSRACIYSRPVSHHLLKRGSCHLCHCLVILHSHLPPPTSLYDILLRVFSKLSPNAPRWNLLSIAVSCTAEVCEGSAALFQLRLLIYSGGGRQNAASTRTLRAEWRCRLLAVRAKATSRWPDDGTERVWKRLSWSAWVLK